MEGKKTIYFFVIAAAFCIVLSANIYNSIQSYKYRGNLDTAREQLTSATETNTELTNRISRIAEVTGRIKETADANITDAREIIEAVEILRSQIKELEDCCDSFNQFEYYQHWDNEFRNEELIE